MNKLRTHHIPDVSTPQTTSAPTDQHTAGLYRKFNISRTDGRDLPGGDREAATYFVLDLKYDLHAKPALTAYAAACMADYPQLAGDLVRKHGLHPTQPTYCAKWEMDKKSIQSLATELIRAADCMGDDETEFVLEVCAAGTVKDDDNSLNAGPILAIFDGEYPEEGIYPIDPHNPTVGREPEPAPDGEAVTIEYFAYDSECGFETFKTEAEAKKYAQDSIDSYREEAAEGWPEEVENVRWGVVLGSTKEVPLSDQDGNATDWAGDKYVDYVLTENTRSAPDARLVEALEGVTKFMEQGCNGCDVVNPNPDRYPCHSCKRSSPHAKLDRFDPRQELIACRAALAAAGKE